MATESVTNPRVDSQPRGQALSLNSKRLTSMHFKCLAQALDVPTTAASADIAQMVSGKLLELEREPQNVQVLVSFNRCKCRIFSVTR